MAFPPCPIRHRRLRLAIMLATLLSALAGCAGMDYQIGASYGTGGYSAGGYWGFRPYHYYGRPYYYPPPYWNGWRYRHPHAWRPYRPYWGYRPYFPPPRPYHRH